MKRSLALLFVLSLIVVLTAVFPTSAQDSASDPVVCTKDQLTQILTTISSIGPKLAAASAATSNEQSAEALMSNVLAWGDVYQTYFAESYNAFPACVDGVLMADAMGLLFEQQMTLVSMGLLNFAQNAANETDADITQALVDLTKVQVESATGLSGGFSSYTNVIKGGTAQPSWLPACTDDQLKFATQMDEMDNTYNEQYDALQSYLDGGSVDKDTYIAVAKLIGDMSSALNAGSGGCAELYRRAANCMYLYGDTFTALTLGLTVPYVADSDNAEAFGALSQYFNDVVSGYLAPATAEASS